MTTSPKKLRFRFDLPKKEGIGEACILVYETTDGFSLVVTAEHGGDSDVLLTREELTQFRKKLTEIV